MPGKKHQPFSSKDSKTAKPLKPKQVLKKETEGNTSAGAKNVFESFGFAFEGLQVLITQERNFKIHLVIAALVIVTGLYFSITEIEWLIITLTIGIMLSLEAINTALEHLVNLSTGNNIHPLAKKAKDIAAAACLLFALTATVIGIIVFTPYLPPVFVVNS